MDNVDLQQSYMDMLPNELICNIIHHACDSQETYRSLLLLNTRFRDLTHATKVISTIPLRVNQWAMKPFLETIIHGLGHPIRYLWITGSTFKMAAITPADIISQCQDLISLACDRDIFMSVCYGLTSQNYLHLRELTLFGEMSTKEWKQDVSFPVVLEIFHQVTHLRVHNRIHIGWDLRKEWFPSLTHYSSTILYGSTRYLNKRHFAELLSMPQLKHITLTTFDNPSNVGEDILRWDERIRFVFLGPPGTNEFGLWAARARGGECFWTKGGKQCVTFN